MIYVHLCDPVPKLELHVCPQPGCKVEHWFPVGEFSGNEKCEVCKVVFFPIITIDPAEPKEENPWYKRKDSWRPEDFRYDPEPVKSDGLGEVVSQNLTERYKDDC